MGCEPPQTGDSVPAWNDHARVGNTAVIERLTLRHDGRAQPMQSAAQKSDVFASATMRH